MSHYTMHALTLVLNPNARKPKLKPPSLKSLRATLGPKASIHITQNLQELDEFMKELKSKGLDETLCFYGGDGSIARALTSLIRHHGEGFPIPPILAVRAGTINMLCNILGIHESVDQTLSRWSRGEIQNIKTVPTIKVTVGDELPQYGFVFAWGVGFRVLKEYYQRSAIPNAIDGAIVAAQTFLKALHPRADSTDFFRAETAALWVDGKKTSCTQLRSLAVGSIPRLSLGIKPFPPEEVKPGHFHFTANSMPLFKVALYSPLLLFGHGDQRELNLGSQLISAANIKLLECELAEGFTMDGEMFDIQGASSSERVQKIKISAGPVVRFWCPEALD